MLSQVLLRSGKEFSCYLLSTSACFDVESLPHAELCDEGDAVIEPADFYVAAPGAEANSTTGSAAFVSDDAVQTPFAEPGDPETTPRGRTEAQRQRNRAKKKKRRERETADELTTPHRRMHHLGRATVVQSRQYELQTGRHALSGYVGVVDRGLDYVFLAGAGSERIKTLLRHQYEFVELDKLRGDYPICDGQGRIFALVLGWPEGWDQRTEGANRAMEKLQAALADLRPPSNRRGNFAAYSMGYSYGGGQTEPVPCKRTRREIAALQEFLDDADVQAVFKYIAGAIKTWFPEHFEAYTNCLEVYKARPDPLSPPSPLLPFPTLTINCGRATICLPHRDSPNDAAGVCLDWILGRFDVASGGQLVLHEPRKILALDPGRVILFPSAIITHETIPIAPGEWRSGVTGYTPGGLLRYIAQGFATRDGWALTPAEAKQYDEMGETRWRSSLARFKTLQQLIAWWAAAATAAKTVQSAAPEHSL
ncbi:hypothetical protein FRB90_003839 [Tulasnella sp. 427]|nr:hypothetical protein FRB90_003839 [Tulasnella sp. 427]